MSGESELKDLKNELARWRNHFQRGSVAWSGLHHVTAFGAAISSIAIGLVAQQTTTWSLASASRDAVTTLLAIIAAVLASVAAVGGFERKWRSNRLGRSAVDLMGLDLADGTSMSTIRNRLKAVIRAHDSAILAASQDAAKLDRDPTQPEQATP